METDDEAREQGIAESAGESGGPRPRTFRPPSPSVPKRPVEAEEDHYDDDALANAMADEVVRLGLSGVISIAAPPAAAPPAAADPAAQPAPDQPSVPAPTGSRFAPPAPDSVVDLPPPTVPSSLFETASPAPSAFVQPFAPPVAPVIRVTSPFEPALDDPATASTPPVHEPTNSDVMPPTRRSIRDAELARVREEKTGRAGRRAGPAAPGAVESLTAPDSTGVPGGDSGEPVSIEANHQPTAVDGVASLFETGEVGTVDAAGDPPRARDQPVYDLVEPVGRSASIATVFPFALSFEGEAAASVAAPDLTDLTDEPAATDAPEDSALVDEPVSAGQPSEPQSTPVANEMPSPVGDRFSDDEMLPRSTNNPWLFPVTQAPVEVAVVRQPLLVPEKSGAQPTPLDQRVGRASRLFWLWFAANSSVISLAFGGALFSLGMSLRQAIVAAFVGVAVSFLPLGLGTLAGKWSGQPIMIVSRATFGLVGNVVPAVIALVTRLFWGAVLLWMVAVSTARIVIGAKAGGSLSELQVTVIVMAIGFLLALAVAFFGYPLFARIQLVLSVVSGALIVTLVAVTWRSVDFQKALTVADGPVILVVTGVVLVFSFVGLAWANSSGDIARYQAPESSGGAGMLWASFGATLPAFLLIGYGAVLAASNPATATGLSNTPLDTIAGLLPGWYPIPLVLATGLSLLSGVILSIYSGGFALGAVGVRVSRGWATVIVGALVFASAIALGFTVSTVVMVFRDLATTLAVPVAAWAGIFAAEMIIRRRRFDSGSLLKRGGVYPDVNWLNLSMLVVCSVIGLGFTTATIAGLGWEGYLFRAVGVPLSSDLAGTDVGVLIALFLGLLTPLAAGVPTIRRQERGQA